MKKNRLLALFCAVVLAFSCVIPVFAEIVVEDVYGNTYLSSENTTAAPSPARQAAQKVMDSVRAYGRRWGLLTAAIVLIVGIVTAITISEFERQKKENDKPRPESKKKKKR